jgi:hypothetical protein
MLSADGRISINNSINLFEYARLMRNEARFRSVLVV